MKAGKGKELNKCCFYCQIRSEIQDDPCFFRVLKTFDFGYRRTLTCIFVLSLYFGILTPSKKHTHIVKKGLWGAFLQRLITPSLCYLQLQSSCKLALSCTSLETGPEALVMNEFQHSRTGEGWQTLCRYGISYNKSTFRFGLWIALVSACSSCMQRGGPCWKTGPCFLHSKENRILCWWKNKSSLF